MVLEPLPLQAGRRCLCHHRPKLAKVALLGLLLLCIVASGSQFGTGVMGEGTLSLLLRLWQEGPSIFSFSSRRQALPYGVGHTPDAGDGQMFTS